MYIINRISKKYNVFVSDYQNYHMMYVIDELISIDIS